MAHTLKQYDAVHCTSKEQYARIIELAKAAGLPVAHTFCDDHFTHFPVIGYCGEINGWMNSTDFNALPESEFIARMFGVTDSPKADERIAQLEARVAELEAKAKPAAETPEEPKPYRFEPTDFQCPVGHVGYGHIGEGEEGEYLVIMDTYRVEVSSYYTGETILKFYRKTN